MPYFWLSFPRPQESDVFGKSSSFSLSFSCHRQTHSLSPGVGSRGTAAATRTQITCLCQSPTSIPASGPGWAPCSAQLFVHPSQELCEDIAPGNTSALSVKHLLIRHNYVTVVGNKFHALRNKRSRRRTRMFGSWRRRRPWHPTCQLFPADGNLVFG